MRASKYEPHGLLALAPAAFGMVLLSPPEPPKVEERNGVAIVPIRGPLMHHAGDPFCDNYDAIRARVSGALASSPRAIVLRLDSPGGLVAGCLELANDLRAMAAAAGVPLHVYIDGQACSAAYALACAGERVWLPQTAAVGSIGVITALIDQTRADAAMGVRHTLVASGARKTDGNPHAETTDDAVNACRKNVDTLAGIFFDFVALSREVDATVVRSLEASVVIGREAVSLKLADEVGTFDQLLASIASASDSRPAAAGNTEDDMNEDEKARAALKAIIEDEKSDEKAKARAKRALAAMDESDVDDEDEKAKAARAQAEEDAKAKAAQSNASKGDEDVTAATALAEVHKLRAELAQRDEATERSTLLASRPDFSAEHIATLRKAPLSLVREQVEKLPRVAFAPAAAAGVQPTLGMGQGGGPAPHLPPEEKARLDAAMGLSTSALGVVDNGREQLFGAPVPKKA